MEYDEWGNKINNDKDKQPQRLPEDSMRRVHAHVAFLIDHGYLDIQRRNEAYRKLIAIERNRSYPYK